jgi:hypothetical protein
MEARMTFVIGKSRNPIVQQAFAGLRKEQRAEKKGSTAEPADVHTKPAKPAQVRADVHKAAKVKKPAAKPKKGRK